MKKIFNLMMAVAMVSVMSLSLMSCGSNDDEEEVIENGASGKQRIELIITGNTSNWLIGGPIFGYNDYPYATMSDKSCTISCNRMGEDYINKYDQVIEVFAGYGFNPTYPIVVEMEGDSKLLLSFTLMGNNHFEEDGATTSGITVTLKGYRGNKQTNFLQRTFNRAAYIFFHADKSMDKGNVEGVIDM